MVVYINMYGDTYPFMSVHIDMLGDKQNRTDRKLYFTCLKYKLKYGYHNVY